MFLNSSRTHIFRVEFPSIFNSKIFHTLKQTYFDFSFRFILRKKNSFFREKIWFLGIKSSIIGWNSLKYLEKCKKCPNNPYLGPFCCWTKIPNFWEFFATKVSTTQVTLCFTPTSYISTWITLQPSTNAI